jgi:Colicin V production protein
MTTIDILVATYLGWAFYRGRRRGLRAETARIVGLLLTLAFLLGFGLMSLVGNSLSALANNLLQHRGIVVSVLVLLSTVLIVVLFRIRLRWQQKSSRSSEEPPAYGGVAGVVRALLLVIIILLGFDFFLPDFLNKAIVGGSVTGQTLEILKDLILTI